MPRQYMLDTNIASYIIKGNIPAVLRRLVKVPMDRIVLSTITEGELRYGLARNPKGTRLQRIVDEFLARVSILTWDSSAAAQYGRLRAALERRGQPMGNLDTMIGAHALAIGAILVTNDQAFGRIADLRTEDWTK
jgi:tRNA(fMet)-specific endonuclease VapC